jgi:hypothetical protein
MLFYYFVHGALQVQNLILHKSLSFAHPQQLTKLCRLPEYRNIHLKHISPMFAPSSKRMKLGKAYGTKWGPTWNMFGNPLWTWWEQSENLMGTTKIHKTLLPQRGLSTTHVWKKLGLSLGMPWRKWMKYQGPGLKDVQGELLALWDWTSFLSQILIIILVPDNHSFTHTSTLEHLRCLL